MTGREWVTAALKKIGAIASGESLSADEATDGLAEGNRMLSAWSRDPHMDLEAYLTTIGLDDEISLPDGYEDAMVYNLAVRLAPDYGKTVSPEIAMLATESKARIKRANMQPSYLGVDAALLPRLGFNIETGENE